MPNMQSVDLDEVFAHTGRLSVQAEQYAKHLGLANGQLAGMQKRIKELELENEKLRHVPAPPASGITGQVPESDFPAGALDAAPKLAGDGTTPFRGRVDYGEAAAKATADNETGAPASVGHMHAAADSPADPEKPRAKSYKDR